MNLIMNVECQYVIKSTEKKRKRNNITLLLYISDESSQFDFEKQEEEIEEKL